VTCGKAAPPPARRFDPRTAHAEPCRPLATQRRSEPDWRTRPDSAPTSDSGQGGLRARCICGVSLGNRVRHARYNPLNQTSSAHVLRVGRRAKPGGASEQHRGAIRRLAAGTTIRTRPNWSRNQFPVDPGRRLGRQRARLGWPLVGYLVGRLLLGLRPLVAAVLTGGVIDPRSIAPETQHRTYLGVPEGSPRRNGSSLRESQAPIPQPTSPMGAREEPAP
jgi:hypothetical protein